MKKASFPKIFLMASLLIGPVSPAFAQAAPETPAEESAEEAKPALDPAEEKSEKIRELLMPESALDAKEFAEAVKQAKALGATDQQIIEAEIIRTLIHGKDGDLTDLANRLEKAAPNWDVKVAFGIRKKELAISLVHALRAKAAIDKNDEKTFKAEAADCLWEEPQMTGLVMKIYQEAKDKATNKDAATAKLDKAIASKDEAQVRKAFGEALWTSMPVPQESILEKVTEYRSALAMANVKVPLDVKFDQAEGDAVSLAELMKGKKAALLDFHASWCGPCMAVMPLLPKEAAALGPQGVAVIAFNTESVADAKKIKDRFKLTVPVLAEKDGVYSSMLNVDSIPRYVLIGADGKVLFNGHPADKGKLNAALATIGVKHTDDKSGDDDEE